MRVSINTLAAIAGIALLLCLMGGASAGQPDARGSRGYMTTPRELRRIAEKANKGIEPYKSAVKEVLHWANRSSGPRVSAVSRCRNADDPSWIDEEGTGYVYANALAYHLTRDSKYADRVVKSIKQLLTTVRVLPLDQQCRLNFSWGIPEWIASADLIEGYWSDMTCDGPTGTTYNDSAQGSGNCKRLFQNWLAKNAYYIISLSASAQSNWGSSSANATAYIADYLWDRPEVVLVHRHPREMNDGRDKLMSPAKAFKYAKRLLLDRMNGFGVEHNGSTSCDFLSGDQQRGGDSAVKSQFSERGIIPDDARREQHCNINRYNGHYQNYPQLHISNTVQHCELLLRRGDRSCYDNIRTDDIPNYEFRGPDGRKKTTHLYPGRGSIERVINAIIIDSNTEWKHDGALYVAYRYYSRSSRFGQVGEWRGEMNRSGGCSQAICFGKLTHGFAPGESPRLPRTVAPPRNRMGAGAAAAIPLPPAPAH